MDNEIRRIEVVAAIIRRDGLYLATQRGYGRFEGLWEFPGGKIEPGENPREALAREIREELDTEVTVEELFRIKEYDYPDFHLTLQCFFCSLHEGVEPRLLEHKSARWMRAEELPTLKWLPADEDIIRELPRL